MLTDRVVEHVLAVIPRLRIGVLGDLFLDRYLDLDARLTEPSLETGLDAYQVVRVRSCPGAAGTVLNNLAALGVGAIYPMTVIGDDGEGYELGQALSRLASVRTEAIFACPGRRTPTYTKPMLCEPDRPPRELNRLDLKNREPLPHAEEERIVQALERLWPHLDALLVLDQVSEPDCGVVTARVRERLAALGEAEPSRPVIADSRERIGLFRNVTLKPNERECLGAIGGSLSIEQAVESLARRCGRPVFCTRGDQGMLVTDASTATCQTVAAYPISGPTDPVGAGDSSSAALACALASGATLSEAAAFGNLIASITIGQLGTTGSATPEQVRARWRAVRSA